MQRSRFRFLILAMTLAVLAVGLGGVAGLSRALLAALAGGMRP